MSEIPTPKQVAAALEVATPPLPEGYEPAGEGEADVTLEFAQRPGGDVEVLSVSVPDQPIREHGAIIGRSVAGVAYLSTIEDARQMLGLRHDEVLSGRVQPEDGKVVIVTRGGVKLTWPDDLERAKALTYSQRTGQWPDGKAPNVLPWNAPKDEEPKG